MCSQNSCQRQTHTNRKPNELSQFTTQYGNYPMNSLRPPQMPAMGISRSRSMIFRHFLLGERQEWRCKEDRRTRRAKDPSAPKRALSAYMLYLRDQRDSIIGTLVSEGVDLQGRNKVTQVAKRAGKLWGDLPDDEKAPYEAEAETLKTQYKEAMATYQPKDVVPEEDELPAAPDGFEGPFVNHYIGRMPTDTHSSLWPRHQHVLLNSVRRSAAVSPTAFQGWYFGTSAESQDRRFLVRRIRAWFRGLWATLPRQLPIQF